MKILYITELFPVINGSSLFIKGLSEHLLKLGHSSVFLALDHKPELKVNVTKDYYIFRVSHQPIDFLFQRLLKGRRNRGLRLINRVFQIIESKIVFYFRKFARKYSLPMLFGLFYDSDGLKFLLKLLRLKTKDVDLILTTPIPRSCITASLIGARLKKIPVVVTPAYHYMEEFFTKDDKLWSQILKKFDRVITYSESELKYLQNIGVPKQILKSIGIGIPFKEISSSINGSWRKKLNISKDKFLVFYINARIEDPLKGIDTVIKASKKLPDVDFMFVGRYRNNWENLVKKYSLQDSKNLYYLEYITDEEKFQLLKSIDLLVKPSISDSFGLVYFEGMAAGNPVITSNIESMAKLYKDVGISVPFNGVDELVNAITRLKEDKNLYEKLSKNAIKKSQGYSWENIAKKYESTFKNFS